jgi:four helix bundle protein
MLPKTAEARVISGQLLRSGMSVAANYRAVSRSRSRAEFISKIGVVIEEADESKNFCRSLSHLREPHGDEQAVRNGQDLLSQPCSQITNHKSQIGVEAEDGGNVLLPSPLHFMSWKKLL